MSETTPQLALPLIQPAQAQKHVTHNEAVERLDLLTQLVLEDVAATTPPGSPAEGQTWDVGAGASGAWAGRDGQLASWRGGGWLFVTPGEGWRAARAGSAEIRVYSGGSWQVPPAPAPDLDNLAGVGVNASADATNRLAVAAAASLFSHEGAGHQMKLNKAATGDTASLLYQSNWSGRAEMGLAGNDDFSIKTSADGTAWVTALSLPAGSGGVTIGTVLTLTPGNAPAAPVAGTVYFDATSAKARCYDGTTWQDLF